MYIYVASSWRCPVHPVIIEHLANLGIPHYDFKNPPGNTGFAWSQVKESRTPGIKAKGSDWESVEDYQQMIRHPRAQEGFAADFDAMKKADTFIMVLPCGKSAHLELGWAIGAGKRTAILLEDPVEPELMYLMADFRASNIAELLDWVNDGN